MDYREIWRQGYRLDQQNNSYRNTTEHFVQLLISMRQLVETERSGLGAQLGSEMDALQMKLRKIASDLNINFYNLATDTMKYAEESETNMSQLKDYISGVKGGHIDPHYTVK